MRKDIRNVLTESEKHRILNLHNLGNSNNIVITDWLSPDEKYVIFLDELYDIENKKKIGNVFENFDNFKFFLKHSFEVAENIPQQIKEEVLTSINSLILTESTQNLSFLKPYVKQMLEENIFGDAWDWAKETAKGAVKGVSDFASKSWEGIKKTYSYIADGDWKQAFAIIGKGIIWVARKIRAALYNPIGLILDAILVATGIGKSVQFVIWAVVVGLDIYELMTGNYEDPDMSMGWRLLFLGVDIVGLVLAGAAAKTAKGVVGGFIRKFGKTTEGLSKSVKESKVLKGIIEKILGAAKSASGLFSKALGFLQKNAPSVYKFLSGVVGGLSKFINTMVEYLTKLIGGTAQVAGKVVSAPGKAVSKAVGGGKLGAGAKAAVNVGGVVAGIGAYQQGKKREYDSTIEKGLSNPNVESEYNYDDI